TTEEALVRALRERPDDDLSWLVYADWLEEHGDPLGERIRVGAQLEKLAATDPTRPPLEQRQRALESDTALVEWRGRLARLGFQPRWRRGLVTELFLELRWVSFHLGNAPLRSFLEPMRSFLSLPSRFLGPLATLRIRGDTDYGSEREYRLLPDF